MTSVYERFNSADSEYSIHLQINIMQLKVWGFGLVHLSLGIKTQEYTEGTPEGKHQATSLYMRRNRGDDSTPECLRGAEMNCVRELLNFLGSVVAGRGVI